MRFRLLAFAFLFTLPVAAQTVPTPEAFLGYSLGDHFTMQHRVLGYAEAVAEASPRVEIMPYGQTYEGRPLVVVVVASEKNMGRLEAIRQSNLAMAGRGNGPVLDDAPTIVWLSYNVHGNEAVSSEAFMPTLYALADPSNAQASAWLENTVVFLDPMINPDGRERYVQGFKQRVGAHVNPAPEAREHSEPWPGGRANHYYFDLNRDWAWQTQIESQQRSVLYRQWMPHVHADFHEQGVNSPYYFAPAAEPYHAVITPWQRQLQTRIGERNAQTFDRESRLYFTRQVFDLFYPSYGDTWPTYNGAVGMTYEQGGSGFAGLGIETETGDTLTLAMRIANHFATSLNTVAVASENAAEMKAQFRTYFDTAGRGEGAPYAAYVVHATNGPDKLRALTRLLDRNGIAYGQATAQARADGYRFRTGQSERASVEAGDLVVPAAQPAGTLVQVLFEPEALLVDSLTYDITAWALPYVYDLDVSALNRTVETRPYTAPAPAPPSGQPYAYLVPWRTMDSARFLADLVEAGVRSRFATEAFTTNGKTYPPGTLIVTRTDNVRLGARFDEALRSAATAHGVAVDGAGSGYVTSGSDFGASSVAYLDAPRVMVLSGEGLSSLAVGEVWHFFDQQLGYPATLVYTDDFSPAMLEDFDVLVMPSGSYGRMLGTDRLAEVRRWVQGGGRIVALEGAMGFLAGKEGFGLKEKEGAKADADSLDALLEPYGTRTRRGISCETPGAVYRVRLDATHPLAYGYDDDTFALVRSGRAYGFLKDGWNVGVVQQDARVSGFVGAEARERLQDALVYGVEPIGRGQVVYMTDSPLFRGFWEGGKLLFANAVFFVGQD